MPYHFRDVDLARFSVLPAEVDGFSEPSDVRDHACLVDGFDVNIFAQEKIM